MKVILPGQGSFNDLDDQLSVFGLISAYLVNMKSDSSDPFDPLLNGLFDGSPLNIEK